MLKEDKERILPANKTDGDHKAEQYSSGEETLGSHQGDEDAGAGGGVVKDISRGASCP